MYTDFVSPTYPPLLVNHPSSVGIGEERGVVPLIKTAFEKPDNHQSCYNGLNFDLLHASCVRTVPCCICFTLHQVLLVCVKLVFMVHPFSTYA